jgi:hypothetical protein
MAEAGTRGSSALALLTGATWLALARRRAGAARRRGVVVALSSTEGRARLAAATAAGEAAPHAALAAHWAPQRSRTYCGAQTAALLCAALLAAPTPARALSEDEAAAAACELGGPVVRAVLDVDGMTLAQHAQLLRRLGLLVHGPCFADDEAGSAPAMRTALRAALRDPAQQVSVNYHMAIAGQHDSLGGHLSPLTAYSAQADAFLVMDVWPDTEPAWIDTSALWRAVQAVDSDSRRSRGWCVARRPT